MLRHIIIPQEEQWTVHIPKEYLNRKIEILIFPFDVNYETDVSQGEQLKEHSIQDDEDTRLFWESFGSWQDDRRAEKIVEDIYSSRTSTEREFQL